MTLSRVKAARHRFEGGPNTRDGKAFRMLTLIDEYSRECLAIEVQRRLRSDDVLNVVADAMLVHGPPKCIRSDNGPEFAALALRDWFDQVGVQTLFMGDRIRSRQSLG